MKQKEGYPIMDANTLNQLIIATPIGGAFLVSLIIVTYHFSKQNKHFRETTKGMMKNMEDTYGKMMNELSSSYKTVFE